MKVIVDSACDITQDEARELGITVLPLKYYIGEDEYLDGVTVSNHEFYEILEKGDIFPKPLRSIRQDTWKHLKRHWRRTMRSSA